MDCETGLGVCVCVCVRVGFRLGVGALLGLSPFDGRIEAYLLPPSRAPLARPHPGPNNARLELVGGPFFLFDHWGPFILSLPDSLLWPTEEKSKVGGAKMRLVNSRGQA